MTDLLLIAVSVTVSLIADIMVDCYFLKAHKIGSEDYKNSLKFAGKNKSIINQQNIIENMSDKLLDLENQINCISHNPNVETYDVSELKKEIAALKKVVQKSNNVETKTDSDNEKIIHALNELAKRITHLESNAINNVPADSMDTRALERKVSQLNNEIISLKGFINTQNQVSVQNDNLERIVRQLNNEIFTLKSIVDSQQKIIESLKQEKNSAKKTNIIPANTNKPAKSVPETNTHILSVPGSQTNTSSQIVIPDKAYIKNLLSDLYAIEDVLGSMAYEHCRKGFQEILNNGDFDDGEEIMESVHELIKKYIYGSDTKVSATDWAKLEKYIENAGYVAVNVSAGDDVAPYKAFFDRPIPASGGTPNTIKQIQLKPYILSYMDSGEKETLKLCGKCTYYK